MDRSLLKYIVFGNQKSGTTAIASLIADFGGLSKQMDIPEFWEAEQSIHSGRLSFESFVNANPHRFAVSLLKEPCLTFFYDDVLKVFPDSRHIFVVRHPADNIRSMLDRLKVPGDLEDVELADGFHKAWRDVFYGSLLNLNGSEKYIERLARRWVIATEVYLKNRDRMLLAKYEDFVGDKYGFIKRTAEKLGIEQKNDISGLLDIQYQSRGSGRGKPLAEFFGKSNIGIINDVCRPYLKEFSYSELK